MYFVRVKFVTSLYGAFAQIESRGTFSSRPEDLMPFVPRVPPSRDSNHTLYVVTMVSNPLRFKSRYDLYRDFAKKMVGPNISLTTVEVAFGDRHFEVTEAGNPNHVQLQTWHELWIKENALNIGISRLPSDWQYVAWIDADVEFQQPDWAEKTIHALQHYQVIQPWSDAVDLDSEGKIFNTYKSFMHQYIEYGLDQVTAADSGAYAKAKSSKIAYPHCGYAWAARREAIDGIGGLLDWAIVGSGDHHMAWSMVGKPMVSCPGSVTPAYVNKLKQFESRCAKAIDRDVGYVPGVLHHAHHGPKAARGYNSRWRIISDNQFDPDVDTIKDSQGLITLAGNKPQLRDDLRRYFRSRQEDDICAR